MQKINNIQALRGIAVVAVLLFHLFIVEQKYGGAQTLLSEILEFGNFGVDLFFVISGFVMVTVTRGKFGSAKQAGLFLYHRASRIYPLYWVYTLMALAVFLIRPEWINSSQGSQADILASFLLLPSDLLPLVQVGWTLIHEMYFYLVFFLIMLVLPERFFAYGIAAWGVVVTVFYWLALSNSPAYRLVFHPLTIEFLAGCLLALLVQQREHLPLRGWSLVTLAALALIAVIAGHARFHTVTGAIPYDWWRVLIYGVPAFIIVTCMIYAERDGVVFPPALVQTGNASYSIYLSHLFTVNVVGRLWALVAVDGIFDNLIGVTAAFVMAIAVGFVSYWLVETPLLKLSRKLIG